MASLEGVEEVSAIWREVEAMQKTQVWKIKLNYYYIYNVKVY